MLAAVRVASPGHGMAPSEMPADEHTERAALVYGAALRAAGVTTLRTDMVYGTAERPR